MAPSRFLLLLALLSATAALVASGSPCKPYWYWSSTGGGGGCGDFGGGGGVDGYHYSATPDIQGGGSVGRRLESMHHVVAGNLNAVRSLLASLKAPPVIVGHAARRLMEGHVHAAKHVSDRAKKGNLKF